jgi:hypothetical protein
VPPRKASGSKRGSTRGARRDFDLLGRRIGAEAKPPQHTLQAVYDGQHCIGHLISRVAAMTPRGGSHDIGRF